MSLLGGLVKHSPYLLDPLSRAVLYFSRGFTPGKILKLVFLADVLYHKQGASLDVDWFYLSRGPFSMDFFKAFDKLYFMELIQLKDKLDKTDSHYRYVTKVYTDIPAADLEDRVLSAVLRKYGNMSYSELVDYTKSLLCNLEVGDPIDLDVVDLEF